MAEQLTLNQWVPGSSPGGCTAQRFYRLLGHDKKGCKTVASTRAHFADFRYRLQKLARDLFSFRYRALGRFIVGNPSEAASFGLNGLDTKLREWIDNAPNYYIEIGANDGVAQSNTLSLELFDGWRGLLIEPVEDIFSRLKKNRNARRNSLVRAACVSFEHPGDSITMHYANLMSIAAGLDSDIPDPMAHAKEGEKFLKNDDKIRTEVVPAMTMTSALDLAGAPRTIGLLSLDVEGAELEVLQGIDFDRYRIHTILVESRGVERISNYLAGRGYSLRATLSGHDFLFQLDGE